ncbi:MAG: superoxide dismutase [Cu-Zn] SodC [Alphaproteobacteria bacterium]
MRVIAMALFGIFITAAAEAATRTVTVNAITADGVGPAIGTLTVKDTKYGLLVEPKLRDLSPGPHGFHIHANASCDPGTNEGKPVAGFAAGGHFDPAATGKHLGPDDSAGHLGDMPVLMVNGDGTATIRALAPRLKVRDVINHAVVIHAGGDNYSDQPAPLGGGGARIACGVVP